MLSHSYETPYYAVLFTSVLTGERLSYYEELNEQLVQEIKSIDGYLGHDSARSDVGMTHVFFQNKEAIDEWRKHSTHMEAKKEGVLSFYNEYHVRIAKVEYNKSFFKRDRD